MRLMILGGTGFVGRAIAGEGVRRGWRVTVVNRGHREPPPGVDVLRADRTAPAGLAGLERELSGGWDAVVDTWSGAPRLVRDAARRLADHAGRFIYISSRSVHAFPARASLPEDGPVVDASPDAGETDYAADKRGGELAALAAFGGRALLVRPGLILGPHEDVGRLPWWLHRIARGGVVPAPGPPDLPVQYIDARDLATWCLDAVPLGLGGAYNVVSRPGHATMEQLLTACVRVTGGAAELRWLAPEAVLAAGVEAWTELPVWLPPGQWHDFLHQGDVSRALATGLRCRPVAETVADTWAWLRSLGGVPPVPRRPVGLDPQAEARLLAAAPAIG